VALDARCPVTDVPLPAIEALVESGKVTPTAVSPFVFLKPPFEARGARARATAGLALQKDEALFRAVCLVAAPEGMLEIAEVQRGGVPALMRLYLGRGWACPAQIDSKRVRLGALTKRAQLIEQLAVRLRSESSASKPAALLPSEVTLVAQLWPASGTPVSGALSVAKCVEQLIAAGVKAAEARASIDLLQSTELLLRKGDQLEVAAAHRPALEALWSGQLLELQYAGVGGSSVTLTFAGREGRRLLIGRIASKQWQKSLERRGISDEDMLVLEGLSPVQLKQRLEALLPAEF
jgi:hypothetical protein